MDGQRQVLSEQIRQLLSDEELSAVLFGTDRFFFTRRYVEALQSEERDHFRRRAPLPPLEDYKIGLRLVIQAAETLRRETQSRLGCLPRPGAR